MSFKNLKKPLRDVLEEAGFSRPTRPQEEAIDRVLEGKNVLLIAQTGSGKTEAALLPILDKLLENREKRIFCLYITPLRALNRDILHRLLFWGKKLDLDIDVRHGDTSKRSRRLQALDPPHLLITTPETLQAILVGSRMRKHLSHVKYVVVDEIHEVAPTKRGAQLSCALERLEEIAEFKRIGLSATVGSPGKVAKLLQGSGEEVETIQIESRKDLEVTVETPVLTEKDFAEAKRRKISPFLAAQLRHLLEFLADDKGTLLFVNTRATAELLASRLEKSVHHSSLSKEARVEAEKSFKEKRIRNLIATSSMELGIDIGHIDRVVQYMSPRRAEVLLQRAGRAGHTMERVSEAHIVVNDPDDAMEAGIVARCALDGEIEPLDLCEEAFDVVAHQTIGLLMENYEMEKEKVFSIIKRAYPFRNLTPQQFEETLNVMRMLRFVWGDDVIRRDSSAIKYYFRNISTIPDTKQVTLVDISTRERVARLDEEYVAELDVGEVFVCKGEGWKVVKKEPDQVLASSVKRVAGAPSWSGDLMPVSKLVAQKVGRALKERDIDLPVDRATREMLERDLERNPRLDEKALTIERGEGWTVIHSFFGNKINEVISRILATFLSLKAGESVEVKSDQYRIFLGSGDLKTIEMVLKETVPEKVESTLKRTSVQSSLFRQRFLHVARRFGAVRREAEFSKMGLKKLAETYEGTILFEEAFQELLREKFDVEGAERVFEGLKSGEIKLERTEKTTYSKRMIEGGRELVTPERPTREILKALKRRLEKKKFKLACLYCKRWSTRVSVGRGEVECGNCGSKLLAPVWERDEKLLKKKELSAEEKRRLSQMRLAADLYLSYGEKALLALAGRGVGPKTAARILRKSKNEEDLLERVLEAEKTYARTREFWATD